MVISLDLAGVQPSGVRTGVSPLAELMAALHVLAEPDHHPESRQWVTKVDDGLSPQLRTDLFRFAPLWARYRMRTMYPVGLTVDRDLSAELEDVATLSDEVWIPLTANAIRGRGRHWSDPELVMSDRDWVRECEQRSFARGDLAHSLVSDPQGLRDQLIEVLHRCDEEFFAEDWARIRPSLERSAQSVRARLKRTQPAEVVASLSHMASRRDSDTKVWFDKVQSASAVVGDEGLLLVPSVRAWPHVIVKVDPGLPIVVHYLVAEDSEADALSQGELRRRLLALAEPSRWELCRHLIGESITTGELASRTGMTKFAVSRHLRALREADLISSQRDGRQVFHRMNPAAIAHLGHDTLRGLIR